VGIIRRKLWIAGLRGRREVNALFDTGALFSLVREDVAMKA